ncbi:unnamed protein product [Ilex paraguariensis]|uniref:Uncharacterized protein n=1 Tax=Ilex paraguariensis TaxID=185542 RepID=A0ABC8UM11_9AQUA
MRENVVEELRQLQPDDENKQKMMDIFKRFHSEEEMDSSDEDGAQPETLLEALSHCLEQTCSLAFRHMGGLQFGLGLMDDATERELKSEKQQKSKRLELKNKLKSAQRKVYFVMCWVHVHPGEAWSSLAAIVKAEKGSAMEYRGSKISTLRMEDKVESKGKPLIKELQ